MRNRWTVVGMVLVCLLSGGAGGQPAGKTLPIVELSGSAVQIGQGHGRQLRGQIQLLFERYLKVWFRNERLYRQGLLAAVVFRTQLLPEHRQEIEALAEAAGIDNGQMMLGNCFLDLAPTALCSTIALEAGASPDGVARFGRNLDFPSLNVADEHSVLLIVRPEGRYGFAAVSWPGLIGVLSGMNEHGLALANMEVRRGLRAPVAMPYTLLYRAVLERCRTVEEAIELLRKTPRQSANNLMLMDASGQRAVVEITPEAVVVRRGEEGKALISTNHQRGQDQQGAGRCWRYDRLGESARAEHGKVDLKAVQRMLDAVSVKGQTMQSMVFEPANRVIYVAAGADATKREYHRIELGRYFGDGARPAEAKRN